VGLVKKAADWKWVSLYRWLAGPEPDPKRLSAWPVPRSPNWQQRVNAALSEKELQSVRNSVDRGAPLGDPQWTLKIAPKLKLHSTLNPRGRPKKES